MDLCIVDRGNDNWLIKYVKPQVDEGQNEVSKMLIRNVVICIRNNSIGCNVNKSRVRLNALINTLQINQKHN